MAIERSGIADGMPVYSSDNEKVGKVIRCLDSGFEIEKGFFFPKDYMCSYSDILRVDDGRIFLSLTKAQLKDRWDLGERRGMGESTLGARSGLNAKEEVRVPIAEEELDVTKRERELGAVRVTKEVVTETKQINVPVTREEVKVERVPVTGSRTAMPNEATFQEGTVTVPIREEEVEIRKRPVVKEEVRISKEAHLEERQIREKLRKEKVDVDDAALYQRSTMTNPEIRAGGPEDMVEPSRETERWEKGSDRDWPASETDWEHKKV